MKKAVKKRLERRGWKIGGAADFLERSPDEEALVEINLELDEAPRKQRIGSQQRSSRRIQGTTVRTRR